MRSEGNPLDLNNLPEDYGKQFSEDSSSSAVAGGGVFYRKKKSGGKEARDHDSGKVYECRFCSLKFCKSQALGGHMNRHRQERETETLNKARQLVFSNDLAPTSHHLGYVSSGRPIQHGGAGGGYHHQTGSITDPSLPFRSLYPSRLPLIPPPPGGPSYMYTSPPRLLPLHSADMNDYYLGHVLPNECGSGSGNGNYTCIGAPVGQGLMNGGGGTMAGGGGGRDVSLHGAEEGLNWGRR